MVSLKVCLFSLLFIIPYILAAEDVNRPKSQHSEDGQVGVDNKIDGSKSPVKKDEEKLTEVDETGKDIFDKPTNVARKPLKTDREQMNTLDDEFDDEFDDEEDDEEEFNKLFYGDDYDDNYDYDDYDDYDYAILYM